MQPRIIRRDSRGLSAKFIRLDFSADRFILSHRGYPRFRKIERRRFRNVSSGLEVTSVAHSFAYSRELMISKSSANIIAIYRFATARWHESTFVILRGTDCCNTAAQLDSLQQSPSQQSEDPNRPPTAKSYYFLGRDRCCCGRSRLLPLRRGYSLTLTCITRRRAKLSASSTIDYSSVAAAAFSAHRRRNSRLL